MLLTLCLCLGGLLSAGTVGVIVSSADDDDKKAATEESTCTQLAIYEGDREQTDADRLYERTRDSVYACGRAIWTLLKNYAYGFAMSVVNVVKEMLGNIIASIRYFFGFA